MGITFSELRDHVKIAHYFYYYTGGHFTTLSALPDYQASNIAMKRSEYSIETIRLLQFQHLLHRHRIEVYLPPGYYRNRLARYRVLYANDGQDMSRLQLKETLERLLEENRIVPVIVVAIHASNDRLQEYGVYGIPDAHGRGSRAHLYSHYLTNRVMPYIERKYRVMHGARYTAFLGASQIGRAHV